MEERLTNVRAKQISLVGHVMREGTENGSPKGRIPGDEARCRQRKT